LIARKRLRLNAVQSGYFHQVLRPLKVTPAGMARCCYDGAFPLITHPPYVSFPQARLQA
jgi:hypothetical protein